MTANWLDLVIAILIVLSVSLGLKRGFGKAIFDFAAFLIALRVTDLLYQPLSQRVQFSADAQANVAWSFAVLFVLCGAVLWYLGKLAYDTTLISLDTFDPALGAILGFGIAIVIGHALSTVVFLGTVKNGYCTLIQQSTLGSEFYSFTTYHHVIETLKRLGD